MMIIINGLPGTGKTTLSKMFANSYGYKYFNDWEIFKANNIQINELEDKNIISEKYSKLIADYVIKNKDDKVVFDLEYSISPNDLIKHGLNGIAQSFYLGFTSLSNDTIFNLFRKSSSNDNVSDDELKQKIDYYKNCSLDYQKQCEEYNLEFIDICKDRKLIFEEILDKIK
ncbi:MAG: hypothetical protein IJW24_03775 [Clostridia bacterium]|nr:hypothetical protein [Clostridia bacterium]